jgi:hypothetical protein
VVDKVLVAGSDTVSFVPNHTHKSILSRYEKSSQS